MKHRQKCWRELGSLGLLGITIPTEYEGTGGSYTDHVIAMEEISRASGSVGLSYVANTNLCMNQIRLNGTDEQKKKYLPRVCVMTSLMRLIVKNERPHRNSGVESIINNNVVPFFFL